MLLGENDVEAFPGRVVLVTCRRVCQTLAYRDVVEMLDVAAVDISCLKLPKEQT